MKWVVLWYDGNSDHIAMFEEDAFDGLKPNSGIDVMEHAAALLGCEHDNVTLVTYVPGGTHFTYEDCDNGTTTVTA